MLAEKKVPCSNCGYKEYEIEMENGLCSYCYSEYIDRISYENKK